MTDLPGGAGERGPLPPHERAWRHPSELAAPPLEATTRGGRVLIISTATVSLLLVGVLALLMTPDRARRTEDAEAIVTDFVTFTPAAGAADGTADRTELTTPASTATSLVERRATPVTTPAITGAFGHIGSGQISSTSRPLVTVTIAGAVMVTPVGNGLAVATEAAVDGADGSIDAVLPSGDIVRADIVVRSDGVVFLAVSDADETMSIAGDISPTDVLYVTIDGTTMPVDSIALTGDNLPEGMPVLNGDGSLVGLYTHGVDGIEVVPVGTLPVLSTTTMPVTESSVPEESTVVSPPDTDASTESTETSSSDPGSSLPDVTTATPSTSTSTSTTAPGR